MDNIFYTHPQNIIGNKLELVDQEARHASKVLRFDVGDELYAADGRGNVYQTEIISITKKSLFAEIKNTESVAEPEIKKVLAFGAIKKRDRLEFAVEKAVELGAWEICVFNADHSERSKINEDRLQSIALSAFKQSKRKWLPEVKVMASMEKVLEQYPEHHLIVAHVQAEINRPSPLSNDQNLMLIGPEGGFSERELELVNQRKSEFMSLGENRLRAETAVISMLSQYLFES
ncbi:RsmE family RNA methyltransferase [Gracilimonas sp.]|uniref:RsmE family RNA methyltransferase n=1 Tax=Gracilimonas sp. TaxID=1974203 RepID=UPI00287105CD|nr:RsmE family RNA methyltransferase [Gracilimonas sp.]